MHRLLMNARSLAYGVMYERKEKLTCTRMNKTLSVGCVVVATTVLTGIQLLKTILSVM